jgi:hypothetical protein
MHPPEKSPTGAHRTLRGELTRATLDALRYAPGPMTTKELARHVMAERGLNSADAALLQLFTRRTGARLRWQKKRGILRSVKDPQHGRFDLLGNCRLTKQAAKRSLAFRDISKVG